MDRRGGRNIGRLLGMLESGFCGRRSLGNS
jgi:hypothetical protein